MAGHSKWSKVKLIRGPLDVKRGARIDSGGQKPTFLPDAAVSVTDEAAAIQALDDYDDTQNVYSNFDISEDLLAKLSA